MSANGTGRSPWFMVVFGGVVAGLVTTSAIAAEPQPSLHGDGLAVLIALVVFDVGIVVAVARRSRVGYQGSVWPLFAVQAVAALALVYLQPTGSGYFTLYVLAGIVFVRLEPRAAIIGFISTVAAISVMRTLGGGNEGSTANVVGADLAAILFFMMGYTGRMFRAGQLRAENLLAEREATREAQAQAIALQERSRLAREMHDVLAHSLSALAVQLEGARLLARERGADPEVVQTIERSNRLARAGLDEARRAIEALRGGDMPGPDRLGELAAAFAEQTGVDCRVELDGEPRELPSDARLAVYRTAQEALTNVRRHAAAEEVELTLHYEREGTRLVVEDRGEATPADGAEEGMGYGLTGMRERAELLGGRLAAAPTPTGFRVELYLPA